MDHDVLTEILKQSTNNNFVECDDNRYKEFNTDSASKQHELLQG